MHTTPRPAVRRGTHQAARLSRQHSTVADCRGFTLVEHLICICLIALLTMSGLAAMRNTLMTHALESSAALLETDLRYARSLALSADTNVRFQVQAQADGGTCYLVYSGSANSCTCSSAGVAQCTGNGQALRVAAQPVAKGVRVMHSGNALLFSAGKGTVSPTATLVVSDADGLAIHQVVNLMGRTRSCSPQRLAGLKTCS